MLAYFAAFGFFTDLIHYRYLFLITPAFYILGAYGMVELFKSIKSKLWSYIFIAIIIIVFFVSGHGVLWPKSFYTLESDNPATIKNRPYYAYTPQSDFKGAYDYIKQNKQENEIIISSHPTFNKIYLHEAGYWLHYKYLGLNDKSNYMKNGREYYVNAEVINGLSELEQITTNNHGYIIFDFYSTQDRIPSDETSFIRTNFEQIYSQETNSYSKIWVYKFWYLLTWYS